MDIFVVKLVAESMQQTAVDLVVISLFLLTYAKGFLIAMTYTVIDTDIQYRNICMYICTFDNFHVQIDLFIQGCNLYSGLIVCFDISVHVLTLAIYDYHGFQIS